MSQASETTMKAVPSKTVHATVETLQVVKESTIAAPLEVVWESILEELGPESIHCKGGMIFEPWPGGRWFRPLENNTGHLWGHVQAIKPPKLLEITGPMFMSYPAISHVQYRLTPGGEGGTTAFKLTHRAIGLIDPEHARGVHTGWTQVTDNIQRLVARRLAAR